MSLLQGQAFESSLPSYSRFKLNRDSREAGNEEDPQFIACVGSSTNLIVGVFKINGIDRSAIIDTGATGSFLSSNSYIVNTGCKNKLSSNIRIKTADQRSLATTQTLEAEIVPIAASHRSIKLNLFILPDRDDIMGHEIVLGMDSIRAFGITIESQDGNMVAHVDKTVIANEFRMLGTVAVHKEPKKKAKLADKLNAFDQLIEDYEDIFAESASTVIDTSPMNIELTGDFSAKARLRPQSLENILEIDKQVKKLIENDIVEPCESTFSANVHLVPKKNGTKRMVVDFRFLNDITVKDHFPLPQVNTMFSALHNAVYFAALDCTDGFLQIMVSPKDRYKTSFITEKGSFQYKRCPFGFTNSPAKFQRTMNDIFDEGLYVKCVIYIDDILVFGRTQEQLLDNLRWVFEKCRARTVKLKKSKCHFNQTIVEFLGFQISHNKVSTVHGKYDPIALSLPTNKTEVRAILGSYNHYARFIEHYADKVAPIRRLTRKDLKFEWSNELTQLVKQLNQELNQATSETIADANVPKYIIIYVSLISIEVTCYDDAHNLVGRAGSVLKDAEKNYTSIELQLLAIVLAYNKFSYFLRGPVTFKTTDKLLLPALRMTQRAERVIKMILQLPPDARFDVELIPGRTELERATTAEETPDEIFYTDGACIRNGKINCKASWAVLATLNPRLSEANLVEYHRYSNQIAEVYAIIKACEIAHREKLNKIIICTDSKYAAGAIQKWIQSWKLNEWKDNRGKPVVNQELLKQLSNYIDKLNITCMHVKGHSTDLNNIRVDRMAKEALEKSLNLGDIGFDEPIINQSNDEEIEQIIHNLEADGNLSDRYLVENGELYYLDAHLPADCRKRLFVPKASRNLVLRIAHDDPLFGGHLGHKRTKSKLLAYYWPKMNHDVEHYIDSCLTCQQQKTSRQPKPGLLQPITTSEVFEQVHIDIVGPIKESTRGNRFVITAIDAFSRYGFAKPVKQAKTTDIVEFMSEEIIRHHGPPKRLVSDNGPQFTSYDFQEYLA